MKILRLLRRLGAALFVAATVLALFARDQVGDHIAWWSMQRIRADCRFDYQHLDLEAWLDPDAGQLRGLAICTLRMPDPVRRRIQLALFENLHIDSVSCEVPLRTTRLSHTLYLYPQAPLVAGEILHATFTYSGTPGGRTSPLGRVLMRLFNPFPAWGLRSDGIELNPYNAWYPLPPVEGFYYTWRATLHEPAWSQTICGGVPVASTVESGQRTTVWESNGRTVSLSAMGGPTVGEATPGMPVLTFHSRSSSAAYGKFADEAIHDIWSFYEQRFGPVPVKSQRIVESPRDDGRCYAVDEISLRRPRVTERGEPINPADWVGVLAHEMGHLRWGYLVRQDNFAEGTWYEGLAEYSSILYCGHRFGEEGLRREMLEQHFAAAHAGTPRPMIRQFAWSSDNSALTYRKSCSVWRMLHYVLGDDAFFATLRELVATSDQSATNMEKIRALAEKHHGASLAWFFDYWWYRDGLPDYALRDVAWDPTKKQLTFTLAGDSTQGLTWAVPVVVRGEGQERRLSLPPAELARRQTVGLEFVPIEIEVDPDVWILDGNRVNNRRPIETPGAPVR